MAKINFPKKQEQRLIPKYLLEYTEELVENHPDPSDPWGGSGGDVNIEAGTGITITTESDDTKVISLDTNPDTFEVTADTGMTLEVENQNPLYKDSKLQMSYTGATRLEGTQISLEANNIYLNSNNAPYYVNNTTHEYKTLATTDQLFSGDYDDLYNKPTIPDAVSGTNDGTNWTTLTIGNDTYDIPQGGGSTYTAGTGIDITNDVISVDNTVAMKTDIPTDVSDLNNDAGYITGINSSDVTTALGYTPYDSSNPSGYITGINSSDVITALGYTPGTSNFSGSYTDLTDKPTIPTATSQLTNDSGFITNSALNNYVTTNTNQTITGEKTIGSRTGGTSTDFVIENYLGVGYNQLIFNSGVGDIRFYNDGNNLKTQVYEDSSHYYYIQYPRGSYFSYYDNTYTFPLTVNGTKANANTGDISIAIPTKTSDLTNDSGFITAAQVPAGWEVVDVYQSQSSTPVSAADLVKLAGDNVCIRYNLDSGAFPSGTYSLFYKKESPALSGYYIFDNLDLNYQTGTSYIGFGKITVDPTDGSWSYGTDYRVYAGHKIEAGSGLVEGSTTTSYGKTLEIDTTTVALKSELFSGSYTDLTNKPDLSIYAESSDLATVATSGSYNDLSNKPTIPTVNDNTITITQGGVTKGSFTLNQNTNQTIEVDNVPGMIGEVIFDRTPSTGSSVYSINLSKDITQYDYIEVYYNDNDDTIRRFCSRFPQPVIGNKIVLTSYLSNSTPRVYTKNSVYLIDSTTSLTIDNTSQQRVGNNEATTAAYTTNTMLVRPYKIIGYKQNSAPIVIPSTEYTNGDTFQYSTYSSANGFLTSGGRAIQFSITTPKLLTNITSITVDNLYTVFRGIAGYVNGSSYIDYANTTGYTVTTYIANENTITIVITATTAFSGGTNNTPINLAFAPGSNDAIKLTFNT